MRENSTLADDNTNASFQEENKTRIGEKGPLKKLEKQLSRGEAFLRC